MLKSSSRNLQRYLVPRFFTAIYFSLKYRCLISPTAFVQMSNQISFGRGTVISPFVILQTQGGKIEIGKSCAIGSFSHISAGVKSIVIGDYVRTGPSITLMGGSRKYKKRDILILDQGSSDEGLQIGNDVLIGANTIILPGCKIEEGAVIGAGCIVNKDVPAYSIVAGLPARIVGKRE
jgi:galactoside O-acetyltransferase